MDFGYAIQSLKDGAKVSRAGWNNKAMWIQLQTATSSSKMTQPYIYMETVEDHLVPWVASQQDLLANDWDQVQ